MNSTVLGSIPQLGLTATLGSTWGINFGQAIKKGEHGLGELVFLSSFFGTLILPIFGYAVYSLAFLGQFSDSLVTVAVLSLSMVAFTSLIHADVVDQPQRKHLKGLLSIFSTKASLAILSGYAVPTVSDVSTGITVGILVGIAYIILPKLWETWRQRNQIG